MLEVGLRVEVEVGEGVEVVVGVSSPPSPLPPLLSPLFPSS